ncbi:Leucine Rich Repeat [Seminavis robusta]|uniref:Leucine Rich Repeat n=1 Tax=Seminavis robusta TaxID=568900 RepID=A0A9N8DFN0_9STRA|nr:Leucine Rich Repeat [Seminavis robusta]|eukprot:Sro69_g038630.1 Leucine Rich Repeat (778) ;mRNA; f:83263-85843
MASNSDVQYVAYLKAKFNLEDADLLQVISLSQRSDPRPEGGGDEEEVVEEEEEEEEEVIEEETYEEELKTPVNRLDSSGYEEVIEDGYEEEEYMDVSMEEHVVDEDGEAKALTPVPAPLPLLAPSPDPPDDELPALEAPPPESDALVVAPAPGSQEIVEAATPAGALAATADAMVEYEEAPEDEQQEYAQSVRMPETVASDPKPKFPGSVVESVAQVKEEPPADEQVEAIEQQKVQEDVLAIQNQENALAIEAEPEEVDPNALAIVPAKPTTMVPADEEAGMKDAAPPLLEDRDDEKEGNTTLVAVAAICVLLLIGIAVVLILIFVTGTIPKFWEENSPVVMSPYQTDCNFEGQAQPNVVSQCNCNSQVTTVADYTRSRYETLSTEFIVPNVYSSWSFPIESCEPENQALLWLSTGPAITDNLVLTQRFTLALFHYSTTGTGWRTTTNWMSDTSECNWFGVTCSGSNLQQIELVQNGVNGAIPSELGLMTQLSTLSLDQNTVKTPIPSNLFSLASLRTLTLGMNQLTGSIPTTIGLATGLENLRLNSNLFRGTIPTELNLLTRLQSLSLEANNDLTGRIATEYGRFTNLQSLSLSNTKIRAVIPSEYGSLVNLQEIRIANTRVGGRIPIQFGQLSRLTIVDFTGSRFRKGVPTTFGNLSDLSALMLGNNELEGLIPSELGTLNQLRSLELHNNTFFGALPSELGNLASLDTLTIQGNPELTGHPPDQICLLSQQASLANFTVDCPTRDFGVVCPIPTCCSACVGIQKDDTAAPEPVP